MHFTEAQDIFTVVDINLHGRTCIKLFSSLVKKVFGPAKLSERVKDHDVIECQKNANCYDW